jgi:hypothetical protein
MPNYEAFSHTYYISDSVALRIHSDTKPQNMKIAHLQKGLILMYKGTEVIGEGSGFGVPIIKYTNETFFSGSSFLEVHKNGNHIIIRKEFLMDHVSRDKFRNLKLENMNLRKKIDYISSLYQNHKNFAQFILVTKKLLSMFGVESNFSKTTSKGKVIVTYTINQNRIRVNLSFSQIDANDLQKVFVLNEQGAHFFRKYSDSKGLILNDGKIGVWEGVTAESAKIADNKDRLSFILKTVKGTELRRGREVAKNSLDWIGLDYELDPKENPFEYEIEIFG